MKYGRIEECAKKPLDFEMTFSYILKLVQGAKRNYSPWAVFGGE
jgi:hypothetical protein